MSSKEEELAAMGRIQQKDHRHRIANDSRDRLKRIADKKFRTCFISALAEFEDSFGVLLWGYGLSEDKITAEQNDNRLIWDQVRKNILDKGNTQSRALSMEIDLHCVEFKGYSMNFGGNIDE